MLKKKIKKIIPYFRLPLKALCMKPSFLIIGAQKAGTTSLFNYLIQHPDILPSVVKKEPHYFDLYYNKGRNWYLSHFPVRQKGKITGEKSPYYLYNPLAPERSYNFNPDFRIIVLLRDPVKRAYSHYHHEIENGREIRSFRKAIEEEMNRVDVAHERLIRKETSYSYIHQRYSYISRGKYAEQLDLWMKFFPREQFYIETAERFFREPQIVCSEIFDFLKLPSATISTTKRHNPGNYDAISESDKIWLTDFFRQLNAELEESYGVNIGEWI
jgi:hypothetical protein